MDYVYVVWVMDIKFGPIVSVYNDEDAARNCLVSLKATFPYGGLAKCPVLRNLDQGGNDG